MRERTKKLLGEQVYICTPVLNASETIDTTVNSVVSQEGNFFLHYHVHDGGSTDDTIHRLERWNSLLSRKNPVARCRGLTFTFCSEKDEGIYDAITKSFDYMSVPLTGIASYINADDILFQGAISTVCKIFGDIKGSRWIIGRRYLINANAEHRYVGPHDGEPCSAREIASGLCDDINIPFIQQEGIFWRHSLWEETGGFDKKLRLAGDWDLWRKFAECCEPQMAPFILGAFRKRKGQLSENLEKYQKEMNTIISLRHRRDKAMAIAQEGSQFHKTLFLHADQNKYKAKSIKINRANSISNIESGDCLCRRKKWRFIHSAVAGWIGRFRVWM